MALVTVKLLVEIFVMSICSSPIITVWPVANWIPSSTATVVLAVIMDASFRSVPAVFFKLAITPDTGHFKVLFTGTESVLGTVLTDLDAGVWLAPRLGRLGIVGFQPIVIGRPSVIEGLIVVVSSFNDVSE